jgi:hypothetical protein
MGFSASGWGIAQSIQQGINTAPCGGQARHQRVTLLGELGNLGLEQPIGTGQLFVPQEQTVYPFGDLVKHWRLHRGWC